MLEQGKIRQDITHSGTSEHRRRHDPSNRHVATPAEDAPVESFSALNLRDRVVIMLLFDRIVTEEQVARVWGLWKREYRGDLKTSLWRLLTLVPEIDPELILAEAARVHGIEEARIARREALPLIERMVGRLSEPLWERMVELRLVPVKRTKQNHSHRRRIIIACHDPTHPEVPELLPRLNLGGYELRYAPEVDIVGLCAEAFPSRYSALYKALKEERARFTEQAEEAPAPPAPVEEAPDNVLDEAPPEDAPNSSSIINFFENMLVEAVRHGASGVCFVPADKGETEIFFQVEEALKLWSLINHIPPSALLRTIKGAIVRSDFSMLKQSSRQMITRWIDGRPIRFRISVVPSGEMLDQTSILVRVVQ